MIGSEAILRGGFWSGHEGRLQNTMQSLKKLLVALAFLAACALVIGTLAYCFAYLFIGGAQ